MESRLDLQFAALADPTRRAILVRLAKGEANVAELAQPFGISQPAISRHLKVLEAAGLIEGARVAQSRPRRLKADALAEARTWIDGLSQFWNDQFDQLETLLSKQEGPAA